MMNAFSIVSSLCMMTVIDFLLAYWGGDWLDNYFQTGDHTWRQICLGLAGLTFGLAIFKLVYMIKPFEDENKEEETAETESVNTEDNTKP